MRNQTRVDNVHQNVIPHLGDNYTIFPAIDGQTDALEDFFTKYGCDFDMDFNGIASNSHGCSRYSVAVICSAIAILQDAASRGLQSILFFEDDAKLYPNFNQELKKCIAGLPDDGDVLKLSFAHARPGVTFPPNSQIPGNEYILNFFPTFQGNHLGLFGTDGLYIKNVSKWLHALKKAKAPIDHATFGENVRKELKTYFVKNRNLCWNINSEIPSTVADQTIPRCHDINHLQSLCDRNLKK